MTELAKIYVALGANLPWDGRSPQETLTEALQRMSGPSVTPVSVSGYWTSPAWPDPARPAYVNAVAEIATDLSAGRLLRVLLDIEDGLGRERNMRWDSRTLDLDIVDYRGLVVDETGLTLPHPRAQERAFVLLPLQEIAPNWFHPVSKRGISELISCLSDEVLAQTRPIR